MAAPSSAAELLARQYLDAIPERVGGEESSTRCELVVPEHTVPGVGHARSHLVDVGDSEADVRFFGRAEVALDTKMHVGPMAAEPAAAAGCQHRRLRHLHHPEDSGV